VSINSTFQGAENPICQKNAEWIVEGHQGDLANFGQVTFTQPSATFTNGSTFSPLGGLDYNMVQNGVLLAAGSGSSTAVTVKYVNTGN
jgi:hypothetical protein